MKCKHNISVKVKVLGNDIAMIERRHKPILPVFFVFISQTPDNQRVSNPLDLVLPMLLQPSLSTGKLLDFVAKTVTSTQAIKLLGKQTTKLVHDVGSVAKNAGNTLLSMCVSFNAL